MELKGQDSERRKFNIMHLDLIEIAHYLGDYLFVVGKSKKFKPNEAFVCLIDVEQKERGNSDDTFGKKSSKRE
ncbi:hypothetical protein ACQKM1_26715 [Peribacillus frigoritolerans]|uniref:hypothetical protein n=1 Tax=Peribacillus frigoritolerans TaxID=450367 RepID=UPI003D083DCA